MDDFELIRRCCEYEKDAWDYFVDKFTRLIYDTIVRVMAKYGHPYNIEEVSDLHNDVFVAVLKNDCHALRLFEARRKCQLSSYISTITVNKTIDHLRKLKKTQSLNQHNIQFEQQSKEIINELSVLSTQEDIDRMDAILLLKRFMAGLNTREQNLCQLYFIEEQAPKDIARRLGITVDHVYVLKQRLLAKLKELVKTEKDI